MQVIRIERNKDATISQSHVLALYSDNDFQEQQTVFLAQGYKLTKEYLSVKGLIYNYSDRLWEWDGRKAHDSNIAAQAIVSNTYSARYFETFLREYFGKPNLILIHMITGIQHHGNMQHYHIYGYFPDGEPKR